MNKKLEFLKSRGVNAREAGGIIYIEDGLAAAPGPVAEKPDAPVPKPKLPPELFMSWDEIEKKKLVDKLKQNPTLFDAIFFERFGKRPQNIDRNKVDFNLLGVYEKAIRANKIQQLSKKSWDELDRANETGQLRELAPEIYREKFVKKYGVEPQAR